MGYTFANMIFIDLNQANNVEMSFQILFARFAAEGSKTAERVRFSLRSLVFAINAERHFFLHFSCLVT